MSAANGITGGMNLDQARAAEFVSKGLSKDEAVFAIQDAQNPRPKKSHYFGAGPGDQVWKYSQSSVDTFEGRQPTRDDLLGLAHALTTDRHSDAIAIFIDPSSAHLELVIPSKLGVFAAMQTLQQSGLSLTARTIEMTPSAYFG